MPAIPHMPSEKSQNAHAQPSEAAQCHPCMWLMTCAELVPHRLVESSNLSCPNTIDLIKLMLTCKFVWFVVAQQLKVQAFQTYRYLGLILEENQFLHIPSPFRFCSQTGKPLPLARLLKTSPDSKSLPEFSISPLLSYPFLSPLRSAPQPPKGPLVGVQQ